MSLEPNVFCYRDAVDQLVTYLGGAAQDAEQIIVRRAIQNAFRRILAERSWQYLYVNTTIQLQAPYNAGTVTYVNATRQLTLSGGTWPTWARYGRIALPTPDGALQIFQPDQIVSSTVMTLTALLNPGQDITTPVSYNLYQSIYPLPADFHRICEPTTFATWGSEYVSPTDWQWLEWHVQVGGYPYVWTISNDLRNAGAYAI